MTGLIYRVGQQGGSLLFTCEGIGYSLDEAEFPVIASCPRIVLEMVGG